MLLVLNLIIIVHELGHLLAAKGLGLPVEKFAIGFGPSLFKWKWKETECSFNMILLGGYVAFPVDDPNLPIDPRDKTKLVNRSIPERALVMSAGVMGNFVLAYLVLLLSVTLLGVETGKLEKVSIFEILPNSPAQQANFKAQDQILEIGDKKIGNFAELQSALKTYSGKPVEIKIHRQNKDITLKATPDASGKLGFRPLVEQVQVFKKYPHSVFEVAGFAAEELVRITQLILHVLWLLVSGQLPLINLSGPVMVVAVGSDVVKQDIDNIMYLTVLISIDIGLINFLPLPALDGGRLFLLIIEGITRRPVQLKVEETIHRVGLVLLLTLGVIIAFKDVYMLLIK